MVVLTVGSVNVFPGRKGSDIFPLLLTILPFVVCCQFSWLGFFECWTVEWVFRIYRPKRKSIVPLVIWTCLYRLHNNLQLKVDPCQNHQIPPICAMGAMKRKDWVEWYMGGVLCKKSPFSPPSILTFRPRAFRTTTACRPWQEIMESKVR